MADSMDIKISPFQVQSGIAEYERYKSGKFKLGFDDEGNIKKLATEDGLVHELQLIDGKERFLVEGDKVLNKYGEVLDSDGNSILIPRTKFRGIELREHKEAFESSNQGKRFEEYLRELAPNRPIEETAQHYCHLADIKEMAEKDDKHKDAKINILSRNEQLYMAVDMFKPSMMSFEISDGKVVFPSNASPEQLKEMMSFLSARGISGVELPENLQQIQDEISQEPDTVDTSSDIPEDKKSKKTKETDEPTDKEKSTREEDKPAKAAEKALTRDDYVKSMDAWCEKNGKRKGFGAFHTGGIFSSWDTWTIFPTENENNMSNLTKKDKDGNRKSMYEARISARLKNGKLELKYTLPAGGKMTSMVADQLVELHTMGGADRIRFIGTKDHDLKEIRTACAKKLVVPVGIGLKVSAAQEMITEARKTHDIGEKIMDYERRLAEQIRENALSKGKDMTETEDKFYRDTMEKVSIAKYQNLFSEKGGINDRLVAKDKAGTDVTEVMASRYAAADVFSIYLKVAGSDNKTVSEIQNKLHEVNAKLGIKESATKQYNDFLKNSGLTGKEDITKITPEQMGVLFDSIVKSRQDLAYDNVSKAYEGRGNSTERQVSDRAIQNADNYFKTNFTNQYSGIMDKAYPVFPSTHDGLEFEIPQKIKDDDAKKKAQNKRNSGNEESNQDRKDDFNKRVDEINSNSQNNEKKGNDNKPNQNGQLGQAVIAARNVKQH